MTKAMPCDECNGKGCVEVRCPTCNGSGEGMYDGSRCRTCKGSGVLTGECPHCAGDCRDEGDNHDEDT